MLIAAKQAHHLSFHHTTALAGVALQAVPVQLGDVHTPGADQTGEFMPGLKVLGNRWVQQRAFRVARVVELGRGFEVGRA